MFYVFLRIGFFMWFFPCAHFSFKMLPAGPMGECAVCAMNLADYVHGHETSLLPAAPNSITWIQCRFPQHRRPFPLFPTFRHFKLHIAKCHFYKPSSERDCVYCTMPVKDMDVLTTDDGSTSFIPDVIPSINIDGLFSGEVDSDFNKNNLALIPLP